MVIPKVALIYNKKIPFSAEQSGAYRLLTNGNPRHVRIFNQVLNSIHHPLVFACPLRNDTNQWC